LKTMPSKSFCKSTGSNTPMYIGGEGAGEIALNYKKSGCFSQENNIL